MAEVYQITTKEEAELITDPFTITIIGNLEVEEGKSSKDLAAEIHEPLSMVNTYLENLSRVGFLMKREEGGEELYYKVAHSYSLESLSTGFEGDIHNHIGFGLIHHLEGNFADLLSLLDERAKREDFCTYLEGLGYEDLHSALLRAYLTREEYEELKELVMEFCEKKTSRGDENQRLYEVFFTISPNLAQLRKRINEREKKE